MACPFAKLSALGQKCPVSKSAHKPDETGKKNHQMEEEAGCEPCEGGEEKAIGGAKCPFGFDKLQVKETVEVQGAQNSQPEGTEGENGVPPGKCPLGHDNKTVSNEEGRGKESDEQAGTTPGKCPLGYDSVTFKIGPLSCVLCRALLFDSSRCVPCRHIYCRACIARFQDCPLCGLDIESIVSDPEMQALVDTFIEGHARSKRSSIHALMTKDGNEENNESPDHKIKYEDISVERGSFLVQQAMRAFQANNLESAKARLELCVEDSREELSRSGDTSNNCSQLGALLGMLGDCCRGLKDNNGAIANYEESVEFLTKLPEKDLEVVHALSVSLNKLGDLKYYAQDLEAARAFYARALNVRLEATSDFTTLSSQVLDVAVSLAKVADVDYALGKEQAASEGFQEALKKLENLSIPAGDEARMLEKKRLSVMTFLLGQVAASK